MRLSWLVVLAFSCNIEPTLVPCGELVCPPSARCVEPGLCATPEQIAACDGIEANSPCNASAGYCEQGICLPNVCGDGRRTGNEVCDGTEVSLTCGDFAFYDGTLACTPQCTIDRGGCIGSCGDQVIQTAAGEQCDGAPPAQSCVGYGGDFGRISCNEFCTPAFTTDCYRFGWRELLAPGAGTVRGLAANARGALALDGGVRVSWDGIESTRALANITAAGASSERFVIAGPFASAWFDGSWHDMQSGTTSGNRLVVVADVFYAKQYSTCVVYRGDMSTGVVTLLPAAPLSLCWADLVAIDRDRIMLPYAGGILEWDGVGWTTHAIGPVTSLASSGAVGALSAHMGGQRVDIDITQSPFVVTPRRPTNGQFLFTDADDNDFDYYFDEGNLFGNIVVDGVSLDLLGPEGGAESASVSAQGQLLVAARGVYSFEPQWIRTSIPYIGQMVALADGAIGFCASTNVGALTGTGPTYTSWSGVAHGTCYSIAGDPRGVHLVASSTGIWRFDPATTTYVQERVGFSSSIAGDLTDAVSAGLERVGGTWVTAPLPAGCTSIGGPAGHPGHLYGTATCNTISTLLRRIDGAWAMVAPLPSDVTNLHVGRDGSVFASGAATTYRLDGSMFVPVARGGVVAALSADEFFVRVSQTTYDHHRGAEMSQVRAVAIGPFIVTDRAIHAVDYLVGLYTLPRMPKRYGAAGL